MSNFSRHRPASKGDITVPTERVARDPVTGEITRTILDGVQLAFESVRRWYETAAERHQLSQAERERLADMVLLDVLLTKQHTDADMDALAALLAAMSGRVAV